MKISYSQDEERFRNEVRDWLRENIPHEIKDQTLGQITLDPDLLIKWHKTLFEKGWIAPEFPKELGGAGFNDNTGGIYRYM